VRRAQAPVEVPHVTCVAALTPHIWRLPRRAADGMLGRGTFSYEQLGSYTPKLVVRVPRASVHHKRCRPFVFVPLSPSVYFDPYTARVEGFGVTAHAQLLGHTELEKPIGWSTSGAFEVELDHAERRGWWEQDTESLEPSPLPPGACRGAACEQTAVLVALDNTYGKLSDEVRLEVPLHLRYARAFLQQEPAPGVRSGDAYAFRAVVDAVPGLAPPLRHALDRGAGVLDRAIDSARDAYLEHVTPWVERWTRENFQPVSLLPPQVDGPLLLARCAGIAEPNAADEDVWEKRPAEQLLPETHKHLAKQLVAAVEGGEGMASMFARDSPLRSISSTMADIPAADASLYPTVQLVTVGVAVVLALWLLRGIRRAVHKQ